jgi:hypothetical protein
MNRKSRGLVEDQDQPVAVEEPRINLFRRHAGQAIEGRNVFGASGGMAAYRRNRGL